MLLQVEQRCSLALTSRMASARPRASASSVRRMWKASRCALLLPTPGSFFSSSIRRVIGSAKRGMEELRLEHSAQAAQHSTQAGLHRLVNFLHGAVDCSSYQVLQHLDVA